MSDTMELFEKTPVPQAVLKNAVPLWRLCCCCCYYPAAPPEKDNADEISIAALFQTESGDTLHGSAACFSTEATSDYCQIDCDGTASAYHRQE